MRKFRWTCPDCGTVMTVRYLHCLCCGRGYDPKFIKREGENVIKTKRKRQAVQLALF